MKKTPTIPLNVNASEADKKRILREESFWDGPKLVGLCAATLLVACVALWFMANTTIPSPHPMYLFPWEHARLR